MWLPLGFWKNLCAPALRVALNLIRYDVIYLLTAIGLTPGGSSTVHIYTQTIHRTHLTTRTTQLKTRTTHLTT